MFKNNSIFKFFDSKQSYCSLFHSSSKTDFLNYVAHYDTNIKCKTKHVNCLNTKWELINICNKNNQLKDFQMKDETTLHNYEWNYKVIHENIEQQILNDINKIEKNTLNFKKYLKFVSNSKKWLQKKKDVNYLKKLYYRKNRNFLDLHINQWLKNEESKIDLEKNLANLSKHADVILSNVRAKQYDSKKFLILLQELNKLRKLKVIVAKLQKEPNIIEANKAFNSLIEKLNCCWFTLSKEYCLEELGLQLMMKNNSVKTIEKSKDMFISNGLTDFFQQKNSKIAKKLAITLISSRVMWNEFIVDKGGSKMPIGYMD